MTIKESNEKSSVKKERGIEYEGDYSVFDSSDNKTKFDQNNDDWVDGFTIIHSGFAAEAGGGTDVNGASSKDRVWSHKWALDSTWISKTGIRIRRYNVNPGNFGLSYDRGITRLGVVAHELGHFFGLPDLYDVDFSSAGIHVYGVMGSSWGVDGSQLHPQSFNPWSKAQLGWIVPKTFTNGDNKIYPSNQNSDSEIFVISRNFPSNEEIFVEYRQSREWDSLLPGM